MTIELEALATTTAPLTRLQNAIQADIGYFNAGESAGTLLNNLRTAAQIGIEDATVALQDGEAVGLVTIRFEAANHLGSVRMLYALPDLAATVTPLLVDHAVARVWAEPDIAYLRATLFIDQPGVRAAFDAKGALALARAEMRVTDLSAFAADAALPDGFRFAAWSDAAIDPAAEMTVAAYRGTPDDALHPDLQTLAGMQTMLRQAMTDRRDGFDADASALVYHGDTLAGLVVCARGADDLGYITEINVGVDWRRRGLARALLTHALHTLTAKGAAGAKLWVTLDNPARQLYEALGFRVYMPMWSHVLSRETQP